jgi:hypothetical protein
MPKFEVANTYETWKLKIAPLKTPATKEDILSSSMGRVVKDLAREYGYEI